MSAERKLFIAAGVSFIVAMVFFLLAIWMPHDAGDLAGKFGGSGAVALVIAFVLMISGVVYYIEKDW